MLRAGVVAAITMVLVVGSASFADGAPRNPGTGSAQRAHQVPRTLAQSVAVQTGTIDPSFPVDFVAVKWTGPPGAASVRLQHRGRWGGWQPMGEDGVQQPGRFGSALVPAGDAEAYQVRVPAGVRDARVVAINTTDGPSTTVAAAAPQGSATAAAAAPIDYVTRAEWGADESLRSVNGKETWPAEYFPVQKLTVHHTATANGDPDPAATVRAIYRYHAVDRGWGDIGYQFLVDEAGNVYEGRHTDDDPSTPPGRNAAGDGVVAAHVSGWNSGNLGTALLGTLTARRPTAPAQRATERLLAELAARHGIDPRGSARYVNPSSGASWTGPNIPGHRDFAATECPGGGMYALLPTLRDRVAQRIAGTLVEDSRPPAITAVKTALRSTAATITWTTTGDPADSQVQYWAKASPSAVKSTPLDLRFVTGHSVAVAGLRKGTVYQYRVISADRAGNRSTSGVITFTAR